MLGLPNLEKYPDGPALQQLFALCIALRRRWQQLVRPTWPNSSRSWRGKQPSWSGRSRSCRAGPRPQQSAAEVSCCNTTLWKVLIYIWRVSVVWWGFFTLQLRRTTGHLCPGSPPSSPASIRTLRRISPRSTAGSARGCTTCGCVSCPASLFSHILLVTTC